MAKTTWVPGTGLCLEHVKECLAGMGLNVVTNAEQRVLDAMAACTESQLEDCIRLGHRIGGPVKPWGMVVAEAELARREAKRG